MSFVIDTIKLQNKTSNFKDDPIFAEIGISSNATEFSSEENIQFPSYGYYYVSLNISLKNLPNTIYRTEEWNKTYTVCIGSLYDYIYGYSEENDKPIIIEKYSRIEDAIHSKFLDYFLYLEELIVDVKVEDYFGTSSKPDVEESQIETNICINSIKDFKIISTAIIGDSDPYIVQLNIDSTNGFYFDINDNTTVIPDKQFLVLNHLHDVREKYPLLEYAGKSFFFRIFYTIEKEAHNMVKDYLLKEFQNPNGRFSKKEYQILQKSILQHCFGDFDDLCVHDN